MRGRGVGFDVNQPVCVLRNTHDAVRNTSSEVVIEVIGLAVVAVIDCRFFGIRVDSDTLDSLGLFRVAVDCNEDSVHFHVAGCYLERERHLGPERFQDVLDAATEHRIVGAGHADIGDIRSAFGQNSLVGGYYVGVRAETQARPAIEMVTHSDFFAGRLGVKINDYNVGLLFELGQDSVNGIVWAVAGLHEKTPYQSNDCYGRAFAGFVNRKAFAGRMSGEIGRPNDIIRRFQRRYDFPFAVGMVAQSNEVYAVSQQFIVDLPRQAGAAGGVFGVGYDAINAMPFDNKS